MKKEEILKAIYDLRKSKKRRFNQTFDFIINLKDFDVRRESFNISILVPYPLKKVKICAFLEKSNDVFDKVITKADFESAEKEIKNIAKEYNICVASAKLMPEIAKRFGRILGPVGKMPDPKIDCVVMSEDKEAMAKLYDKLKKIVRIMSKERSIKIAVGRESIKDDEIAENCIAVYNTVSLALPNKQESIKNVMLKLTMSKPIKILDN